MMEVPKVWTVTDASVSALWVKAKGEEPYLARKARQLYRDIVAGKYRLHSYALHAFVASNKACLLVSNALKVRDAAS